jgi:hypothetical protein
MGSGEAASWLDIKTQDKVVDGSLDESDLNRVALERA